VPVRTRARPTRDFGGTEFECMPGLAHPPFSTENTRLPLAMTTLFRAVSSFFPDRQPSPDAWNLRRRPFRRVLGIYMPLHSALSKAPVGAPVGWSGACVLARGSIPLPFQ